MSPVIPPAVHCGIVTTRLAATCAFYFEHFGFRPLEITADYALLGRDDGSRLALLQANGDGQPAVLRQPTRGSGVWLSFTCDDLDPLHTQLVERGVEVVADPEYTIGGERRCVVRDPNGVLVYITMRPQSAIGVSERSASISQPHTSVNHHESHLCRIHRIPCH